MKTWQMIKELTENEHDEFENCKTGRVVMRLNDNCVYRDTLLTAFLKVDDEWKKVQYEVTWQEAIEAWVNGKEVSLVKRDVKYLLKHSEISFYLNKSDFKDGKWYIL